jgi:hypothetical protein
MIALACLAVALVCLVLSGAMWLGLDNAVTEAVLATASARRIVIGTFFLNIAALVGALYYFFIWRPESERIWLWGILLGWSGLSVTGAFAAFGVDFSVQSPLASGTLRLSPSEAHTAIGLIMSALFSAYCMKQYERTRRDPR